MILGLGNWILEKRKLVKGVISDCLAVVAVVEEKAIPKLSDLLLDEGECARCACLEELKVVCHELGGLL